MDFLCFTIRENKIAIRITDVYHIVDSAELTYVSNKENKSVYLIRYTDHLIPVFEINNDFNVNGKDIIIINSKELFGLFIDSIDDIFRDKLPVGYQLMTKEDFEILIRNGRDERASEIELF